MSRRGGRPPGPVRTIVQLLVAATIWSALAFVLALAALGSGGQFQRYQVMSVLSGSMVPTLEVGDLVIARVVTPEHMEAGEVVTFRDPESGKLVTHRVQSIMWRGEIADVVTRGDDNEVGETWSVTAGDRVGEGVLRVPRLGYVVGVLGTPAGQLGLAGVAAVLGVWILVVIWRPQRDAGPAAPAPSIPPTAAAATA